MEKTNLNGKVHSFFGDFLISPEAVVSSARKVGQRTDGRPSERDETMWPMPRNHFWSSHFVENRARASTTSVGGRARLLMARKPRPASRWSVSKRKKTERQSRRLGQKRQRPKSSRPSHYKHICYLPRPPKVFFTDFHQTNSINSIVPLQFRLETNSAIETNPLILRKTRQSPSKEK